MTSREALEAATWRKSSRSGNGAQCVEACWLKGGNGVRDSKNPDGDKLLFSRSAWLSFTQSFKD